MALFQNMGNREYVKIVFTSMDITAEFAKSRKSFMKNGIMIESGLVPYYESGLAY